MTVLSLTRESPYLGKTVFIVILGPDVFCPPFPYCRCTGDYLTTIYLNWDKKFDNSFTQIVPTSLSKKILNNEWLESRFRAPSILYLWIYRILIKNLNPKFTENQSHHHDGCWHYWVIEYLTSTRSIVQRVSSESWVIWQMKLNLCYVFIRANPTVLSCDTNQVFSSCVQAVCCVVRKPWMHASGVLGLTVWRLRTWCLLSDTALATIILTSWPTHIDFDDQQVG